MRQLPARDNFVKQATHILRVTTAGKGLVDITREVCAWVSAQAVRSGLLTLFCRHTSASLLVQENADPDVRADLLAFFADLVPERRAWMHDAEGPDDMPAHVRSALTQTSLAIPIMDGRTVLGTWQGIYLFEHRDAPRRREIVLHVIGDLASIP
jgi:secondary thiamine-phosphate synthase enzyme